MSTRKDSCMCGAVNVLISRKCTDLGVCHCPLCRKWAGGPFMEIECGSDVQFEGAENISVFQSSSFAERGFCKKCGSHLFIRAVKTNEYGVPPGLFEKDDCIALNRQVFYDKKPEYYSFANATRNINSDYIYQNFPEVKDV